METYKEIKDYLNNNSFLNDRLTIDISPVSNFGNEDLIKALDAYVVSLGLKPIRYDWNELKENTAEQYLTEILHKGLAYGNEIMNKHTAKHISEKFISLFGQYNCKFFSNGEIEPDSKGWSELTDSTSDFGVVVVGKEWIGLICVEDED
ncbi:hypothetical protein [Zooshikella sp. RANM57]|uniref:hypothetical protein n=1 Tax=Zooshikella sp. RANM57 TaxID=3425863 RepID=UPI003D6FD919